MHFGLEANYSIDFFSPEQPVRKINSLSLSKALGPYLFIGSKKDLSSCFKYKSNGAKWCPNQRMTFRSSHVRDFKIQLKKFSFDRDACSLFPCEWVLLLVDLAQRAWTWYLPFDFEPDMSYSLTRSGLSLAHKPRFISESYKCYAIRGRSLTLIFIWSWSVVELVFEWNGPVLPKLITLSAASHVDGRTDVGEVVVS